MRRKKRKPAKQLGLQLYLSDEFAATEKGKKLLESWNHGSTYDKRRFAQGMRLLAKTPWERGIWSEYRNQVDFLRKNNRRYRLESKRKAAKIRGCFPGNSLSKLTSFFNQTLALTRIFAAQNLEMAALFQKTRVDLQQTRADLQTAEGPPAPAPEANPVG